MESLISAVSLQCDKKEMYNFKQTKDYEKVYDDFCNADGNVNDK